jgi:peptidoglycan/LPS O-acetylase OafA/YrhL
LRGRGTERFAGLDLLRGIAALAVLALHLPWPAAFGAPLPRAYLAVDLFFLLSGFVISHAYSQQLGTIARFRQYCVARLIRLYPLYCAAILISAVEFLAYLQLGRAPTPT